MESSVNINHKEIIEITEIFAGKNRTENTSNGNEEYSSAEIK